MHETAETYNPVREGTRPSESRALPLVLDQLADRIKHLDNLVQSLTGRLAPLLSSAPETAELAAARQHGDLPEIPERISIHAEQLDRIAREVGSLCDRLAL